MKILFVNDYGTLVGGAEQGLFSLRDELRRRGHDVRFFASSAGDRGDFVADYRCFGTTSRFRTLLQTANFSATSSLRRVLADFQPDVVQVKMFLTQLSPLILPVLRKVPSIYDVAWYRPICPTGTKMLPDGRSCQDAPGAVCWRGGCLPFSDWAPLMIQMKLWRRWRNVFRFILAHSEAVKKRLLQEGIGPVTVVPHGLAEAPSRVPLTAQPTVVFAGRLVREKGVDVLLRAFSKVTARIPGARLLVAGEGKESAAIRRQIDRSDLRSSVSMLGFLGHSDLERAFAGAWVQAVPSVWEEPFGIVAVEAMMRGTAIVATNSGGLAEIVEEGHTGFLVPANNEDDLAQALLRLLGDRPTAESMGAAAHRRARDRFGISRYADNMLSIYERLSKTKGMP